MSLAFEILGIGSPAPNDDINRTFDVLPVDCMALIKEYATDRRAPRPVALLVKRSKVRFAIFPVPDSNPPLAPMGPNNLSCFFF